MIEHSDYKDINVIELASNLAHNRTLDEIGGEEDDLYEDPDADTLTYKEDVQDTFNEWYDYYLTEIENV